MQFCGILNPSRINSCGLNWELTWIAAPSHIEASGRWRVAPFPNYDVSLYRSLDFITCVATEARSQDILRPRWGQLQSSIRQERQIHKSRGERVADSDCPAASAFRFTTILGVCVPIFCAADGDNGDGDGKDDSDGDGVGDRNYSARWTLRSQLATSTSALKLAPTLRLPLAHSSANSVFPISQKLSMDYSTPPDVRLSQEAS